MSKLTNLQEKFIEEYLIDLNATAAARRAGYSSPDYGRKLIALPHVKTAIQEAKDKRATQNNISVSYVVKELADLYESARKDNELSTAVRCLELLGRHVGAFEKDNGQRGNRVIFVQNFNYDPKVKDLPPGSQLLEITDQGHTE